MTDAISRSVDLVPAIPADALAVAEMSRDLIETGLGWSWGPATRGAGDQRTRKRWC